MVSSSRQNSVGCKLHQDNETKIDWYVFVKPVNVSGFEWKKTEEVNFYWKNSNI